MISDVDFLTVPVIRGMKEIPVFFTSAIESVIVHTTEDVKVTEDIVQSFTVPSFTGWSDCNMVRIGNEIYWCSIKTDVRKKESLIVNAEYCGIASQYDEHSRIEAVWSRLPYDTGMTEIIPGAIMMRNSRTKFGDLGQFTKDGITYDVFWIEMVADKVIIKETSTTSPPLRYYQTDGITRYGTFVGYNAEKNISAAVPGGGTTESGTAQYPTLTEIMNWRGVTGRGEIVLGPTSIKDINISRRCPYAYTATGGQWKLSGGISVSAISPPLEPSGYERTFYELDRFADRIDEAQSTTVTITASDPSTEAFTVVGEQGEIITSLDWSYGQYNANTGQHTLTAVVKVRSDITGIYTDVTINDVRYVIPEGKLTWNSSAWDEYRAYSMNYDRGVAALNAEQARNELLMNKTSEGIGNAMLGALGGGAAGSVLGPLGAVAGAVVGAGASLATGLIGQDITYNYSLREQEMKEKMIRSQPGNLFNQGYGNAYLEQSALEGAGIITLKASNISATQSAKYHKIFGYPSEGYRNMIMDDGYYRGMPFLTGTGPKAERLANELMNGVNIKLIRGA